MQRKAAGITGEVDSSEGECVKPLQPVDDISSPSKDRNSLPRHGVTMALENDSRPAALAWAVQLVGVAVVSMTLFWSLVYRGGVAWTTENKGLIFNVTISSLNSVSRSSLFLDSFRSHKLRVFCCPGVYDGFDCEISSQL